MTSLVPVRLRFKTRVVYSRRKLAVHLYELLSYRYRTHDHGFSKENCAAAAVGCAIAILGVGQISDKIKYCSFIALWSTPENFLRAVSALSGSP